MCLRSIRIEFILEACLDKVAPANAYRFHITYNSDAAVMITCVRCDDDKKYVPYY